MERDKIVAQNKEKAKNLTQRLCAQFAAYDMGHMSEAQLSRGRQLLADAVAVAVAGSAAELPPSIAEKVQRQMGGNPQASVIGFGEKTSVLQAAMINGVSTHVLDFEPAWYPSNHLMSSVMPVALAIAEHWHLDGKQILKAIVKGTEFASAMRTASNITDVDDNRFHPPGAVAPLAALATAGSMLQLNENQMRNALGILSSRCGGLKANGGTHTKCMHCGVSCYSGLHSAILAMRGFTGNVDVLEAYRGYIEAFFDWELFDADCLLEYGKRPFIIDPGYEIKLYPCNFFAHLSANAILPLRGQIKDAEDIERIYVKAPYHEYLNRPRPKSGLDGKFSLQYVLACALLDGKVVFNTFKDERRFAPDVERLLGLIEYEMDPAIKTIPGKARLEVTVFMKDGSKLESVGYAPKSGKWGAVESSFEDHLPKLMDCLALKMAEEEAKRVVDMTYHVDKLGTDDVQELMRILRCG